MSEAPAAPTANTPKGRSGRVVAVIMATLVLLATAGFIVVKVWPKTKAARVQARVVKCLDEVARMDQPAVPGAPGAGTGASAPAAAAAAPATDAEVEAQLERCAKLAGGFSEVAGFPGWGAEAAKREAQALGVISLTAFDRAERARLQAPPGKGSPTPALVTRTLLRALELWPEVLDDQRVFQMWRMLGQPAAEKIDPTPALRSRPAVRRALVRWALRNGDFARALGFAKKALLARPDVPPLDAPDGRAIAEALDEALLLCAVDGKFASAALEPIVASMQGGTRQARYRAACALAGGDLPSAQGAYEAAIEGAVDADERTLVRGELAALLATLKAPSASQVTAALAHARAALAEPAPTRPQAARGRLMALAALAALAPEAEVAKVLGTMGPPPWVYAPPTSPEDVVTLDRAPPVAPELLARAAERGQVAEWRVAFQLRQALEEARLERLEAARATLARARELAPRQWELRHLTVMIDALASDPGLSPTPEERDRDREVLAQGAGELDQLIADARAAAPPGRPAPPAATTSLGVLLISRAALAMRQDLRARAGELLGEAWPLVAYVDTQTDGADARGAHWRGGAGLRSLRAVVIALRGDHAELDALKLEIARDKGISEDEAEVVQLAMDLSESRTADVARALEPAVIGFGPSFAATPARRELLLRALGRDGLLRAQVRTDGEPQDRRAWLLLRRVLGGMRAVAEPDPATLPPTQVQDLLRF